MAYFVTGATGFIGRYLIGNLLERGEADLRAGAQGLGEEARRACASAGVRRSADRRRARRPRQAEARRQRGRPAQAQGQGRALLPSRRDLRPRGAARRTSRARQHRRHAQRGRVRDAINAGCFHHVSSIAAAGLYDGVFREDMFDEAEELDHPYFRTKHDSEGVVRRECKRPVPHLPARVRRRRLARPARSTRSTAPTTSSS